MRKLLLLLVTAIFVYAANPIAVLETSKGNIELELRPDLAPKTVENFVTHIKNGYYNGVIFHRIIPNFMIQCGDPTGTGRGGESIWGGKFRDEFNANAMFDQKGVLAMANAGPNTNGSQFFITTVPTPWLNGRHTIFGYVKGDDSFNTVRALEYTPTNGQYRGNRPLQEVKIIKAYIK